MYQGQKFDREQLIFMVESVFNGVTDRIESCLPPVVPKTECQRRKAEIDNYIDGCVAVVGITLPIIYAQLTDDGMGTGDFPEFDKFEKMVERFVRIQLSERPNKEGMFYDTRPLAVSFVNANFDDYLTT